jgi:hypothetical protein
MEMSDTSVRWGTPVYEYAPALLAHRFFPDPTEGEQLTDFVARRGGAAFFDGPDWREQLDAELSRRRSGSRPTGTYETDDERTARVRDELVDSRRVLSERLGHPVEFLSFPQGGMDEAAERLALEAGYSLWTMPSRTGSRAARATDGPHRVYRCGSGYGLFGDARGTAASLLSQRLVLARHFGNPFAAALTRTVGLWHYVSERIGGAR